MKLIIDIDEKIEEYIKDYISIGAGDNVFCYPDEIVRMIQNGTPIPDNATNGQIIQTLFKPNRVGRTDDDVIVENYDFSKEWWNAPYQKGGKQ